ncbi:MAG: hypothetical protein KAQ89_01775 [Planctomycetes bacterium]|nr:hypothetical protein [Planctomycetota bacterium]
MSEKKQNEILQVGAVDTSKENSPILDSSFPEESKAEERKLCWFNGAQFAPGAEVCSGGVRLRCAPSGNWVRAGNC